MASFRFRFEQILHLKEQLENQKKNEFAQLQNQILQERGNLNRMQKQLENYWRDLAQSLSGIIRISYIQFLQNLIGEQHLEIDQQEDRLRKLHQQEHIKRWELVEAMKQRRLYQKLRENQHEAWRHNEAKQEQKFIDYIALTSAQRRLV